MVISQISKISAQGTEYILKEAILNEGGPRLLSDDSQLIAGTVSSQNYTFTYNLYMLYFHYSSLKIVE